MRGEQRPAKKIISALDVGIEGIEDDSDNEAWTIKDGVSPDMLKQICMREDISHYCFDITRKCFSKHVSKHRNYPSLVYYCINNHMYWISEKETAYNLVQQARETETKTNHTAYKKKRLKRSTFTHKRTARY